MPAEASVGAEGSERVGNQELMQRPSCLVQAKNQNRLEPRDRAGYSVVMNPVWRGLWGPNTHLVLYNKAVIFLVPEGGCIKAT